MRKIMGNNPQVSTAIIIHSPLQISSNDLLHQGQTADRCFYNYSQDRYFEHRNTWCSPGTLMEGLVWFDKIFQVCHGPTSFIAYERGWVIFEFSHVFRSGGSLMFDFFFIWLWSQLNTWDKTWLYSKFYNSWKGIVKCQISQTKQKQIQSVTLSFIPLEVCDSSSASQHELKRQVISLSSDNFNHIVYAG
jgi:hypothetical protein